jgi:hypothetical protein
VDISSRSLLNLISDNAATLREIFLNEVFLKLHGASEAAKNSLWIGYPDEPRPNEGVWLAENLRDMEGLHLDILRATGLGYDNFQPDLHSAHPNFDLTDPCGLNRSFDQRFVEAVFASGDPAMDDTTPAATAHRGSKACEPISSHDQDILQPKAPLPRRNRSDYDAESYQQLRNTTSHYNRSIDGYFYNHNEQAIKELQRIIAVADKGISLVSEEIDRLQAARIVAETGDLDVGQDP